MDVQLWVLGFDLGRPSCCLSIERQKTAKCHLQVIHSGRGGGGLLVLFSLCSGYFCTTVKLLSHLNCIICYAIRDIYYRCLVYEYCVFGSAFMKLLKIYECIALSRIFLNNGTSNCNETILHMRTFPTAYSNCWLTEEMLILFYNKQVCYE